MVAESKKFKVGDKVVIGKNKINVPEGTIYTVEEPQHFNGVWIIDSPNIVQVGYAERKYIEGWADFTLYEEEAPKQQEAEHTGGSVSALDKQVSGNHYKDCGIQPIEYIHANGLSYLEGNVIKYTTRHSKKNGKQDILKAIHYLELILEMEYKES